MTSFIPSVKQCLEWIDKYEMLDNIRAHSFLVARVAEALIDGLQRAQRTEQLADRDFVIAGALMHDIAKTLCLKTGCHHAQVGRDICVELGYPELGELVAEHVILNSFTPDLYRAGVFGARELVFYADKRVRHDRIVPLSSRLSYIIERYGNGDSQKETLIRKNFRLAVEFEKYLFSYLDFPEESLAQQVKRGPFA
jgi:uncharacterized protein